MSENQRTMIGQQERQKNIQLQVLKVVNLAQQKDQKIDSADFQVQQVLNKLSQKVSTEYFLPDDMLFNQSLKEQSNSKTKDAISKDKALYRSLMFLRKLDQDFKESRSEPQLINGLPKGTIIWNSSQKLMYEKIESDMIKFKAESFIKPKITSGRPTIKSNIPKKPRPIEIINEKIQIGKYGPQPYQKEDNITKINQKDSKGHYMQVFGVEKTNSNQDSLVIKELQKSSNQNQDQFLKLNIYEGLYKHIEHDKVPLTFELNTSTQQMFTQTERARKDSQENSDVGFIQSEENFSPQTNEKVDEFIRLKEDLVKMDKISNKMGFDQQFCPQIGCLNQLSDDIIYERETLEIQNEEKCMKAPNLDKIYSSMPIVMNEQEKEMQSPQNQVQYLKPPKKYSGSVISSNSNKSLKDNQITRMSIVGKKIHAQSISPRRELKTKINVSINKRSHNSLIANENSNPRNIRVYVTKDKDEDKIDNKSKQSRYINSHLPMGKKNSSKVNREHGSGSAITKGANDTSVALSEKNQTMNLLQSVSNTFQNTAQKQNQKEEYLSPMIKSQNDSLIPLGIKIQNSLVNNNVYSPKYLKQQLNQIHIYEQIPSKQIMKQANNQVGHSLHILQVSEGQQYMVAQDKLGNPQIVGVQNTQKAYPNRFPSQTNFLAVQKPNMNKSDSQILIMEQNHEITTIKQIPQMRYERKKKAYDYMQVFQGGINLNELTNKTKQYLYSDSKTLYSNKNISFIKNTLLQLGGQNSGLMSITSKNPTKKKYQSCGRFQNIVQAKKINVDFNQQLRPQSEYMTHQNSRQMNLVAVPQKGDQSDIKHILDCYDKRDDYSKCTRAPSSLFKQINNPRLDVETTLQRNDHNYRSPLIEQIQTATSFSPKNYKQVSKLPLQQMFPEQPKQILHVIDQESKSSFENKSNSNMLDSFKKPPQAPIRKHITMMQSEINLDMKQTLNPSLQNSNCELQLDRDSPLNQSAQPQGLSPDTFQKQQQRGMSAKIKVNQQKQIASFQKTSENESQISIDQIQDLDKLSKRSSIQKSRLYSNSKIAKNQDLPANILLFDTSKDEIKKDNLRFSPRNANKKGVDFINELLKQRQERHMRQNVPQIQNLIIPMNYDTGMTQIEYESNTLREYKPTKMVDSKRNQGHQSNISTSFAKLKKNIVNCGKSQPGISKQQIIVSRRNIYDNQINSRGFPQRVFDSAKYQNNSNKNSNIQSFNKLGQSGARKNETKNNMISTMDFNQNDSPIKIDQEEGYVSNRDDCTQRLLFGSQNNTIGFFNSSQKLSQREILTDRAFKKLDGMRSKIWDGVTQSSMPTSQDLQFMNFESLKILNQENMIAQSKEIIQDNLKYGSYEKQRLKISRMRSSQKFQTTNRLLSARDQPNRFSKNQHDISINHDLKIQSARSRAPSDIQKNISLKFKDSKKCNKLLSYQQSKKFYVQKTSRIAIPQLAQKDRLVNFLENNGIPVQCSNTGESLKSFKSNRTKKAQTGYFVVNTKKGRGLSNKMKICNGLYHSEIIIDEISSQINKEQSEDITTQNKQVLTNKNHNDGRIDTQYDRDSNPSKQKLIQNGTNGFRIIEQNQSVKLDQNIDNKFISELFDQSNLNTPYLAQTCSQFVQQEYQSNKNLVSSLMKSKMDIHSSDNQKIYEQMILDRDKNVQIKSNLYKQLNLTDSQNHYEQNSQY